MRQERRGGLVRRLRREPSVAERLLWPRLRRRQLSGWKFRRQADVGPYVVDFLSHDARLAVEIDGPLHALLHVQRDQARDAAIIAAGYRVLRIAERDVRQRIEWVLAQIAAAAPPPLAGEGQGRGASSHRMPPPTSDLHPPTPDPNSPTPDPSPASGGGEICGVAVSALSAHERRKLRRSERRSKIAAGRLLSLEVSPTPGPSPASEGGGP